MEELTVKLGLLMESAEAQQALAANALERLREHTAGIDAVVREEIRATLLEELQALSVEGQRTARALVGMRRAIGVRALLLNAGTAAVAAAIPLTYTWWVTPSQSEVRALRAT